jgi:NADPH:quinone reductase-like Zn-dependent oxidoreductase
MRAAAIDRFGPPADLTLHTLPVPPYGRNEVLIAVHAAAFQINVAESANETDEDFSAVIRQMEKLARSDAPIEGWRSAAASAR